MPGTAFYGAAHLASFQYTPSAAQNQSGRWILKNFSGGCCVPRRGVCGRADKFFRRKNAKIVNIPACNLQRVGGDRKPCGKAMLKTVWTMWNTPGLLRGKQAAFPHFQPCFQQVENFLWNYGVYNLLFSRLWPAVWRWAGPAILRLWKNGRKKVRPFYGNK